MCLRGKRTNACFGGNGEMPHNEDKTRVYVTARDTNFVFLSCWRVSLGRVFFFSNIDATHCDVFAVKAQNVYKFLRAASPQSNTQDILF